MIENYKQVPLSGMLKIGILTAGVQMYMNPSQVEGYKILIFVHNYKAVLKDFERPRIFEIRDRNRF